MTVGTKIKSLLSKLRDKSISAAVVLPVAVILLVFGIVLYHFYFREKVIAVTGGDSVIIVVEPEGKAARASGQYLAYNIERKLGTKAEIVTERKESAFTISILCGEELSKQSGRKEKKKLAGAVVPANTDGYDAYSVALTNSSLTISVPDPENCFGAVKAVTDRWLRDDCGLKDSSSLRISRAMVEQKLKGLPTGVSGEIRILTQNMRCSDDKGGNSVEERASRFFQLVAEYQPDLIGTQETTWAWMQLLENNFSDRYGFYGCSRLGPDTDEGEWNTILYRKDRFTLLDGETFWLSNTPSVAASEFNCDGLPRICTWALLQDRVTGKTFLFSNTHFQNGNTDSFLEVRAREAEILFRRLRSGMNRLKQYPGFLTGDFNGEPGEPYYSEVIAWYEDARNTAITDSSAVDYSYHGYGQTEVLCDFCFHSPDSVTILDYRILDKQYGGYVSDHYGVLVTAVLN